MEQSSKLASLALLLLLVQFTIMPTTVVCLPKLVPEDVSKLKSWVDKNINEFNERKASTFRGNPRIHLDMDLANAEDNVKVITVGKDGFADYQTITDAVNSIPMQNKRRTIVRISGGEYWEKFTIDSSRPFVTLYGDPVDMPKIVFNGTAAQYGTFYSATVAVESDYFMAVNVAFVNSAPMPDGKRTDEQALAVRISGDRAAFHNCKFVGFQDTLCDDRGRHFFLNCYIRGTVDFIFGNGKSIYLNSTIESVAEEVGVITAQGREKITDTSGFTFIYCNLTGIRNDITYLGRPWRDRARVVFAYTYMGRIINDEGWFPGEYPQRNETLYYGEYKCKGPGACTSRRVKYAKMLTDEEAKPFLSMTYIKGNKWLLPPPRF